MTTPTGAISLAAVQTEFGGANPISLSEYYRGGSLVPGGTAAGTSGVQIATSGAIRLGDFRGVADAAPVNPLPTMTLGDTDLSTSTAGVIVAADGTISGTGSDSVQGGLNWFAPTTAGIGASYWARVTVTAGSAATSGGTAWLQLSASRSWLWTQNVVGSKTATITIEIASDAGGTVVVASRAGIAVRATVEP